LNELGEKDEGFLFGGFGIVDAFYWPVLWVRITCASCDLKQVLVELKDFLLNYCSGFEATSFL